MTRSLPADVAALVRAGHIEEVEPGLFRRPRMPSRAEVHALSVLKQEDVRAERRQRAA